jgi:hypothetical protein
MSKSQDKRETYKDTPQQAGRWTSKATLTDGEPHRQNNQAREAFKYLHSSEQFLLDMQKNKVWVTNAWVPLGT